MLGKKSYGDRLLMQLDGNAAPRAPATVGGVDAAAEYSTYRAQNAEAAGQSGSIGFKGSSLAYRKIGEAHAGLEVDDLFAAFQAKPLFKDACDRAYGRHAAVSVYRSMVRLVMGSRASRRFAADVRWGGEGRTSALSTGGGGVT